MRKNDPQSPQSASGKSSRRGRTSAVLVTLIVALSASIGFLVLRTGNDDLFQLPSKQTMGNSAISSTSVSIPSARLEVTSRLREILQVRDRALLSRKVDLLTGIYTIDCECLEDGRALINQLRKENIVWRGVRTEVAVTSAEEVNDRLWLVVATVETPPVRIETESGRLIRIVPSERNRVRFALAKPKNERDWLLGHASTFE
jgi:hypothetical protein